MKQYLAIKLKRQNKTKNKKEAHGAGLDPGQ